MSAAQQYNYSRTSGADRELRMANRDAIKAYRKTSAPAPPQKKMSIFQKLFSIKSFDEEDENNYGSNQSAKGRRYTVEVDKSYYYDRLTLPGDSDEAMMAKAGADFLIDQTERIFLTKPRPKSTNSSPKCHKANRKPAPTSHSGKTSPEINGNVLEVPRHPDRADGARSKENNKEDCKCRASTQPQTSPQNQNAARKSSNAARFQGRLQRGNRFDNGKGGAGFKGGSVKRRSMKMAKQASLTSVIKVDITKPLPFPNTPETILEYHKKKPILDENEEWLVVELNEYECLVDGLAILKIIAKHSKFFEVEPDELWQEFFDFVDEIPAYDEVINFDIWQEFRDKKYSC